MRLSFTAAVVAVGLCALVAGAATTVGSLEPTTGTWRAYRGADFTTLVCSNSSEAAMLTCISADAERRATSTRYQLRYPTRYVTVTYRRATGTATLSWTPPTQNTNGTALTNLAGYRISYGTTTAIEQTIQIANPGVTSYTVPNLAPGTYYFAVRAYTSGGTESANSNITSKVIM